jgi:hypothetical protein
VLSRLRCGDDVVGESEGANFTGADLAARSASTRAIALIGSGSKRDNLASNRRRRSSAAAARPITGPYSLSSSVTATYSLAGTGCQGSGRSASHWHA